MTVVKTPTRTFVERENGDRQSWSAVQALDHAFWLLNHGAASPRFDARLNDLQDDEIIQGGLIWATSVSGQISGDRESIENVKETLREEWSEVRAQLSSLVDDVVEHHVGQLAPIAILEASASNWRTIARSGVATSIVESNSNANGPDDRVCVTNAIPFADTTAFATTDLVAVHDIDTAFNDEGWYADGEHVVVIEPNAAVGSDECGIYEGQYSFTGSPPINYSNQGDYASGTHGSGCVGSDGSACGVLGACKCVSGSCTAPHATATSSVIAGPALDGTTMRGARLAQQHVYNTSVSTSGNMCDDLARIVGAYVLPRTVFEGRGHTLHDGHRIDA